MSSADSSEKQWVNRMRARLLLAQTNANPVEQRDALKECIDELTPELAASLLATMDLNDLTGVAAQQLFDFWVLAEPADAAAWAQSLEGAAAMPSFMNLVALRWAVSDLKAAGSWVHTLPSGILRNDLMRTIGSEAVRSNPQEALRLAAELPEDGVQAELVCRAASEWAVTEPSSVMEWAEQIPDQMLRERVIRDIAIAHAGCDPANAVSFLQVNTSQGPEQDRAIVSIVQSWAEKDPVLASAWVKQFPDDLLGKDAVNNVIQIWASKDLHAPRDWLLTLPSGEMRNTGILAYARELRRTNEDLAEQWTSYVTHRE